MTEPFKAGVTNLVPFQQLEQGCPTLFLEIYHPVDLHSNPNKAHLIQQREQGCPILLLEIYHPVGFHVDPNFTHLILIVGGSKTSIAVE